MPIVSIASCLHLDAEEKLANITVNVYLARHNSDLVTCLLYD